VNWELKWALALIEVQVVMGKRGIYYFNFNFKRLCNLEVIMEEI
jgi:hypothetical protein